LLSLRTALPKRIRTSCGVHGASHFGPHC
jgi:hypothetical protein